MRNKIKGFCPNKLFPVKYEYTHYEDCVISGCPGHTAEFQYYSTSDTYKLDFGDGECIFIDQTQINLIDDFIKKLKE